MIAYYYCSYDVLASMLGSKCIWLTDLTKSNDRRSQQLYNKYG